MRKSIKITIFILSNHSKKTAIYNHKPKTLKPIHFQYKPLKTKAIHTMKTIKLIILSLLISNSLTAQYYDCIDAYIVCNNNDVHLDVYLDTDSTGNTGIHEMIDNCLDQLPTEEDDFFERWTSWLKYEFISSGEFAFTIYPADSLADIDFAVLQPINGCDNLSAIRCMFSGDFPGGNSPCLGATGLSYGSTDIIELVGCNSGDDNFLAPVNVLAGEVYFLAVRYWSGQTPITIEHTGTAQILDCMETNNDEVNPDNHLKVFPNPVSSYLQINGYEYLSKISIKIFDSNSQLLLEKSNLQSKQIDIKQLQVGVFFMQIYKGDKLVSTKKIIKI